MLYSTAERFHWLRFETGRVPVPRETQSLYKSSPLSCNSRGLFAAAFCRIHSMCMSLSRTAATLDLKSWLSKHKAMNTTMPVHITRQYGQQNMNLPSSGHTPPGGNKLSSHIFDDRGYMLPRLLDKSKYSLVGRSRLEDSRLRLHLLKSHIRHSCMWPEKMSRVSLRAHASGGYMPRRKSPC